MLFFILCLCFALFPEKVLFGAQSGLALCINSVIPSLLPFMLISSCMIKSKFSYPLGAVVSRVLSPIMGISDSGCVCLITGLAGGYGAGAKAVIDCYHENQISKKEAETLLAFCNNAGPLFVIGTIGLSFFSDSKTGVILYVIQVITAIMCGAFFCFNNKYEKISIKKAWKTYKDEKPPIGKVITQSAVKSGEAIICVVIFVITFSSILEILPSEKYPIIAGFLEVTKGCAEMSRKGKEILPIISGLLSWGGLSVHFQANALCNGELSMKKYYLGRIFSVLISYMLTRLILFDAYIMLFISIAVVTITTCILIIKNVVLKVPQQF